MLCFLNRRQLLADLDPYPVAQARELLKQNKIEQLYRMKRGDDRLAYRTSYMAPSTIQGGGEAASPGAMCICCMCAAPTTKRHEPF